MGASQFEDTTMKFQTHPWTRLSAAKYLVALMSATALAGCGGGRGGGAESTSSTQSVDADSTAYAQIMAQAPNANDARRFLTQATFGPDASSTESVQRLGYSRWIDAQIALPVTNGQHLNFYNAMMAEARASNPSAPRNANYVVFSAWKSFLSNEDQLRQRMAYALSQIFVVSLADDCLNSQPQAVASYADMLTSNAFGSYRTLLENVTRHPAMGCYLSHLKNRKEDATTGRQPDENFAREIMQLFSIGLHQLNINGTPTRDGSGRLVETYTSDDVKGLAKVFTGLSFACSTTSGNCFWRGVDSPSATAPEDIWTRAMMYYPSEHSTSEKRFLGITIPSGSGNPNNSLGIALDTLANHPNVAPFISKQLIQRLVTSNPSPEYVQRVATRFKETNGNLGQVARAILLDREARLSQSLTSTTFGKLREPVLRYTALYRMTGARSNSGKFLYGSWSTPTERLGQIPYMAPSVFNFFRPGYTPPGTGLSSTNLVAPEFQQLDESSAASYVNWAQAAVDFGTGNWVAYSDNVNRPDIRPLYLENSSHPLMRAASSDLDLIRYVNDNLLYGTMSEALGTTIAEELAKHVIPTNATEVQVNDIKLRKVKVALLLTLVSPDFLVQR